MGWCWWLLRALDVLQAEERFTAPAAVYCTCCGLLLPYLTLQLPQLYNEDINDLLAPENLKLPVHESKEAGVYVAGLREDIVVSPEQVHCYWKDGLTNHVHVLLQPRVFCLPLPSCSWRKS